jgi:hypothetical protein
VSTQETGKKRSDTDYKRKKGNVCGNHGQTPFNGRKTKGSNPNTKSFSVKTFTLKVIPDDVWQPASCKPRYKANNQTRFHLS